MSFSADRAPACGPRAVARRMITSPCRACPGLHGVTGELIAMNVRRALRGLHHVHRRRMKVVHCVRDSAGWQSLVPGYLGAERGTELSTHLPSTRDGALLRLEDFHDLILAWDHLLPQRVPCRQRGRLHRQCRRKRRSVQPLRGTSRPPSRASSRSRALSGHRSSLALNDREDNGLTSRVSTRQWALSGARWSPANVLTTKAPARVAASWALGATHGCTVEGVSLATLFERERIETIDMLKMDIEGAEHDVLLSAPKDVLRRIRTLALEYHPNASKEVLC